MSSSTHQFRIPLHISETAGLARESEHVRLGVPFPDGLLTCADDVSMSTEEGNPLPCQSRALARWANGSVKWLLVDTITPVVALGRERLLLVSGRELSQEAGASLVVHRGSNDIEIETGMAAFRIRLGGDMLLCQATASGHARLSERGVVARLRDCHGRSFTAELDKVTCEEQGPVVAIVLATGRFKDGSVEMPLRFSARLKFITGSAATTLEFTVWNPQPAMHAGGLWDLGDRGSVLFKDLTISLTPAYPPRLVRWYDDKHDLVSESSTPSWSHYQDSSGGDRWDSPNHVDRGGRSTVAFRGYRVAVNNGAEVIGRGDRATPGVIVGTGTTWSGVAVRDHWQSFPKALRWCDGQLQAALFPAEAVGPFELQGGEQKRHIIYLDHGEAATLDRLAAFQRPVAVGVEPDWTERSRVIPWFTAVRQDDEPRGTQYVRQIVAGPTSFASRREIIDEYGWRNFGDLYADHEAIGYTGSAPFVSHYNNQYDFVYGAFLQFHRTGLPAWRQLMLDAAQHVIDIDLYRTSHDKAAFNGGLFWHTDHYKPAVTCTHRTYSRANGTADYGGGPSNEHNYSSGLLHYYYATGDSEAARAVTLLADWVCDMDDGSQNVFALLDDGPTGQASASRDATYHGPGRGAGNSINTLMDGYAVTGRFRYWRKAEELIQRCIHPNDNVAARQLDDPESRWSYLVFMQVLGKYLWLKTDRGEEDFAFAYARASLLHYGRWMRDHETPYKDQLHKVEIPTETWPAHDIRKCHALHLAAMCAVDLDERQAFRHKAAFFYHRCLDDLLSFETAYLTRPLVILCSYGTVQDYFKRASPDEVFPTGASFDYGEPQEFLPQRSRLRTTVAAKVRVTRTEITRLLRERFAKRLRH